MNPLLDGLQGENSGFDVLTALQHGILQRLDAESKDIAVIPSKNTLPQARTISPREIGENHNTIFHPRHEFWKHKNGHTYLIRFSESGGLSWYESGPKEEHFGHLERDRPESLLLQRGSDSIKFTVRDDPPPSTFSTSLSTSSDICHISPGSSTFGVIISITSHETRPITVAIENTPFDTYGALGLCLIIDIQDQDVNKILDLPSASFCSLDCRDLDDYPTKLILQEFLPEVPYVQKYFLEPFDHATATGGELECLSEGHRYSVRLSLSILEGFGSWCWTSERAAERCKKMRSRLGDNGTIRFAVDNVPVNFQAEK
jgi:hypothetical protein